MKKFHDKNTGKMYYALPQEDYEELRNIETMLADMAEAAYSEKDHQQGNEELVLSRPEVHFFYMEVSMHIGAALDGKRRRDLLGPSGGWWQ